MEALLKSLLTSIFLIARSVIYNLKYPHATIGFGTTISNSVIAHNVRVGEDTVRITGVSPPETIR